MTREKKDRLHDSQAYRAYKTQLNKLFDGGGALPEALKQKLSDAGVGNEAKQRKQWAQAILAATMPRDVKSALSDYETNCGTFPEEEDVLGKLLDLSDEKIVLKALQTVQRLQQDQRLKRQAALKARIKTVQITLDAPAILALCQQLLQSL